MIRVGEMVFEDARHFLDCAQYFAERSSPVRLNKDFVELLARMAGNETTANEVKNGDRRVYFVDEEDVREYVARARAILAASEAKAAAKAAEPGRLAEAFQTVADRAFE